MTTVTAVGTYLPPWGSARGRVLGPDEDAVTLAVAAARAALEQAAPAGSATAPDVRRVVFVTREL
ncbi:DNA-binding protein, partial [Frankia sp. AiPs1]|nr:DNA-binding protein [Frankia sp. AiPs1]